MFAHPFRLMFSFKEDSGLVLFGHRHLEKLFFQSENPKCGNQYGKCCARISMFKAGKGLAGLKKLFQYVSYIYH